MADTFKATLRLKPRAWRDRPKAFHFEDVVTGETHYIFPAELAKLLEGVEIEGTWSKFNKGRVTAIRLVKEN